MAIIVNTIPKEGFKYIPKNQKEEEKPFFVHVKPLNSKDLLELEDSVVVKKGEDTVYLASGSFAFKVVQKTLQAWEGIEDASGKNLVLKKDIHGLASEESIGRIPTEYITEISTAIAAISRDPSLYQLYFDAEEA